MSKHAVFPIDVDELYIGSLEIQRMRHFIDWLIPTVVGLVSSRDTEKYRRNNNPTYSSKTLTLSSSTPVVEWTVDLITPLGRPQDSVWISEVILKVQGEVLYRFESHSGRENTKPKLCDVTKVYEQRQKFLDGMIRAFPKLAQSLLPFLVAAVVEENK